ncbi:MAG: hypothetical protein LBQ66_05055 [Planctomycetaceae bacterium]|nr:hypothetical protein [Planctomycetaceae bacterium]
MPTRFDVQFKLIRFYYAQRRAGRPRSSPCRFAVSYMHLKHASVANMTCAA